MVIPTHATDGKFGDPPEVDAGGECAIPAGLGSISCTLTQDWKSWAIFWARLRRLVSDGILAFFFRSGFPQGGERFPQGLM